MDMTAQLPDEVLCHVFSFLSHKDKLRSEAVNPRFQRCIHYELNAHPKPLKFDLVQNNLYGWNLPPQLMLGTLQMLAKKAKFSAVWVRTGSNSSALQDSILSLLLSEPQCLSKVTEFVTDTGCTQVILENFLNRCGKLSSIKLEFLVHPLNGEFTGISFPLDLAHLLQNRRLTELRLRPFRYHQEALVAMFEGIAQGTLTKLEVLFDNQQTLNMVELVNALGANRFTVEQVHFTFIAVNVQLNDLFHSLAQLPALQTCHIDYQSLEIGNQFVPGVIRLLTMNHINIRVTADWFSLLFLGCQIVNMIRQIQQLHPALLVDFDGPGSLILSLGNASFLKEFGNVGVEHCGAEDCAQCQSFFPCLLNFVNERASQAVLDVVEAQALLDWQVDRCRIGTVVDHLNTQFDYARWRALSVDVNQEQLVTINFEAKVDHHLFSITLIIGRCLNNGCMQCAH